MSELALPTVVSDTMWQPSSRINSLDGTLDGGLDVVKCSFSVQSCSYKNVCIFCGFTFANQVKY